MVMKTKTNCKDLQFRNLEKEKKNAVVVLWIGNFLYRMALLPAAVSDKSQLIKTDGLMQRTPAP